MSAVSGSSNKAIGRLILSKRDSKTSIPDLTKDDFIVGDKVYIASNPDKLGTAVFNGTTRFSDGIWIGVALDKPYGKNNGVVQGVRYFQCDENHGIFVRPNNLRHVTEKNFNTINAADQNINNTADQFNNSSVQKESDSFNFTEPFPVLSTTTKLSLGDRVYVAGNSSKSVHKIGTLRFCGCTQFSDGMWAGIELDNPVGKNDGSVNGVRYFSCKPQYGLFALEEKAKKLDLSIMKGLTRMGSASKYGSNESMSSIASNFSSASRTRARTGTNAISTFKKFKGEKTADSTTDKNKYSRMNVKDLKEVDKTSVAIQNVLKEKEQHVEQLIREREIERIDFATATAKIEELEKLQTREMNSFNDQQSASDKKINEMQNTIYLVYQERDKLLERFEEEKKKVEDLMFRIEEKDIDESDLENKTEENESQIFELNEKLALERDLREQLERKLKDAPTLNETCPNENKYVTQIQDLERKVLKQKSKLNEQRNNSKVSSLSRLLQEKEAMVNDLQVRFEKTKKEIDSMKQLQNKQSDENKLLKNENVNLQATIASLSDTLPSNKKGVTQNEEIQRNQANKTHADLEILRNEYNSLKSTVASLNEEIEHRHVDAEEKRLEYNDVQLKCKVLESEKVESIKSKRAMLEENGKLSTQLATYHEQLEKLRSQISDLHNDNKRLLESKSQIENREKSLKIEIDQQKSQMSFLEKENAVLIKSIDESENDVTRNSCILQMSVKIDSLETSIQELNVSAKVEKEKNSALITQNATLYSQLENLRQKRDDNDTVVYDQLQSLKSINQLLEKDKLILTETADSKNKELNVIRDRLLNVSQEYEVLQENSNQNYQKLEREKRLLSEKLRKMEKQLDDNERKSQFSQSGESINEKRMVDTKDQISLLKNAKENSEQQILFLNSVIIEQEKKFTVLQTDHQALKDKIKDLENGNVLALAKPKKTVTPRLYCDVCEIFDSHDTEQCTIIIDDDTSPSPQSFQQPRKVVSKAPRLYCDICEIFDAHNTSDCQDQQTF